MKYDRDPRIRIPSQTDVELAVDGDLETIWKNEESEYKTPRQRLTIREALIAPSRPLSTDDKLPTSEN